MNNNKTVKTMIIAAAMLPALSCGAQIPQAVETFAVSDVRLMKQH